MVPASDSSSASSLCTWCSNWLHWSRFTAGPGSFEQREMHGLAAHCLYTMHTEAAGTFYDLTDASAGRAPAHLLLRRTIELALLLGDLVLGDLVHEVVLLLLAHPLQVCPVVVAPRLVKLQAVVVQRLGLHLHMLQVSEVWVLCK